MGMVEVLSNAPTSSAKASVMPVRRKKPSSLKSRKTLAMTMTAKAAAMSAKRTRPVPRSFLANCESCNLFALANLNSL